MNTAVPVLAVAELAGCPWCGHLPTVTHAPVAATEPWASLECANEACPITASVIAFGETVAEAAMRAAMAWNCRIPMSGGEE